MSWLYRTIDSWGPTFLRLFLAGVMFPHGAQKALGWFGGDGWDATIKAFTENMKIPVALAMMAIITEFAGSISLALGLFTRIWALGMGILITVAAVMVHYQHGFFMNWYNNPDKGQGYEYHLLVLGMSLALLIMGGGKLAADSLFAGKGGDKPKKEPKSNKMKL